MPTRRPTRANPLVVVVVALPLLVVQEGER